MLPKFWTTLEGTKMKELMNSRKSPKKSKSFNRTSQRTQNTWRIIKNTKTFWTAYTQASLPKMSRTIFRGKMRVRSSGFRSRRDRGRRKRGSSLSNCKRKELMSHLRVSSKSSRLMSNFKKYMKIRIASRLKDSIVQTT